MRNVQGLHFNISGARRVWPLLPEGARFVRTSGALSIDTGAGQADEDDFRQEGQDTKSMRMMREVREEARKPRLCDWMCVRVCW